MPRRMVWRSRRCGGGLCERSWRGNSPLDTADAAVEGRDIATNVSMMEASRTFGVVPPRGRNLDTSGAPSETPITASL